MVDNMAISSTIFQNIYEHILFENENYNIINKTYEIRE